MSKNYFYGFDDRSGLVHRFKSRDVLLQWLLGENSYVASCRVELDQDHYLVRHAASWRYAGPDMDVAMRAK